MFSNEQVSQTVIDLTKEMQQYINILEAEITTKEIPDYKTVALNVGKLAKTYSLITWMVGTFTGEDLRVGGFRESVWAAADKKVKKGKDTD